MCGFVGGVNARGGRGADDKALSLLCFVTEPATTLSAVMQDVSSQAEVKLSMHIPVLHCCKKVSKALLHLPVQRSSSSIQHPGKNTAVPGLGPRVVGTSLGLTPCSILQ